MNDMKKIILATVDDCVSDLLYYDRKEDEELSRDQLLEAVKTGVISVEEILEKFESELRFGLK